MQVALLHWVLSGPEKDGPEEPWYLVCKVEELGEVHTLRLYYQNYSEAQDVVNHFRVSIEPLPLFLSDEDEEEDV